ncbi:thiolase C-terminal domain-containing protein [Rhodococcus sp. LB1]|uniref:thiolase C-terminal domain-containing protein n=1 Tax=Rhodococcus sp. LB1 TaxID=1807499 RepID=UPI00077A9214|nr:hypothetical protein [Rhodococcus sp. LB1]KXX54208.1 hypothetical protein AZG88_25110 [Rhodococcus sp. LB1]
MSREFRDKYAIVGVGVSPTARTGGQGKSAQQMEAWAIQRAIEDAGLERKDIDGAVHSSVQTITDAATRKLGLSPNFYFPIGRNAGGVAGLMFATHALATGNAKYVSISLGLSWLSDVRRSRAKGAGSVEADRKFSIGRDGGGLVDLGWTASPGAAAVHAFFASRHMHEFGTTFEQLGSVAVAQRKWANMNPEASLYEKTLTMEQYLDSRWVVHPYRLYDNCVVSDIGCAVIVTTAERAQELQQKPVYLKGIGFGDGAREAWWDKTNFVRTDGAHAKSVAFAEAGIGIDDVDVAELYDCFTGEMVLTVEDYGFCKKGEGGAFIESGATAPGGAHPMNTHGGMLSAYNCADLGNLIEATRQLRGSCGERQVEGAEIALVDGHGGEMILPYMVPITGAAVLGNEKS